LLRGLRRPPRLLRGLGIFALLSCQPALEFPDGAGHFLLAAGQVSDRVAPRTRQG
jgi:hypothetical protein